MITAQKRTPPRRSLLERRVTLGLKIVLLIAISALVLSGVLDFIGRIRSVAVILIGAVSFTYVIYPFVRRLNARLPLIWSILIVYLALAVIIGFGAAVVLPAIVSDSQSLVKATPGFVQDAQTYLVDPDNPLIARLPQSLRDYIAALPAELVSLAQQYGGQAATRVLSLVLSTVSVLATLIVIPVLSVYLIMEAPTLLDGFMGFVPPRARAKTLAIMKDLDGVLGGFIRGQLLVGATIGTAITIMLLILHVKYAVLIGVAAGLLDIIPYVGAVVAFVPATTIAFFSDGWQHALLVAGLFALIFQLEGQFIAPRIVSDSVGLSPLFVIIAILIGGELGGIGGMFLAVPIAAILRVLALHVRPKYRV